MKTPSRRLFNIALIVIAAVALVGCSGEKKTFAPKVFDEAGILKKKTIKAIESKYAFPPDIPLYVRTVKSLPPSKLGIIANEMMEKESYWKGIRPRAWVSKINGDPPWGTGVYILISQKPRLIQIRYGPQIRLQAYRAGIAAGTNYLSFQSKYATGNPDRTILEVMEWLQASLPKALTMPWYLSMIKNIASLTIGEFEDYALPSEGVYTTWLFKPYVYLTSTGVRIFQKPWAIPLATGAIYWILRVIIINVLLTALTKKAFPSYVKSAKIIGSIVLGIALAFPALSSMLLLSGGRLEDELALMQLGITVPQFMKMSPGLFSVETGFVLAGLTVVARAARMAADSSFEYFFARFPDESQVKIFETITGDDIAAGTIALMGTVNSDSVSDEDRDKRPFTALASSSLESLAKSSAKWFVFLLFMPKAIALYAIATFTLPLPISLWSVKKSYKNYRIVKAGLQNRK